MQHLYILGGRRTPNTEDNKSGFSVTKWLKKVFANWGIPFNDPCCNAPTIQPVGVTAAGVLQIFNAADGTWSSLGETVNTDPAITALGTDNTDGYAITKDYNVITGGGANTGVVLPTATVGRTITIANLTASAKQVYANTSDAIDDKTATTGFTILQPEQVITFRAHTVALWQSSYEATGSYGAVYADTISEATSAAGVTADGVLLKDGGVSNSGVTMIASFYPQVVQNNIAAGAGGAIAVTTYLTTINTDAVGDAFTLANGTQIGQMKKILLVVDNGGNAVVTPATAFAGGTTATFQDATDYLILQWNGSSWIVLENYGVTIA